MRDEKGKFSKQEKKVRFTTEKEEGSFPGGGRWELIRDGQEYPKNGDQVQVEGRVFLPSTVQGYLLDSLCFGTRVSILGDCLGYGNWGVSIENNGRYEQYRKFYEYVREKSNPDRQLFQAP